MHFSIPDTEEVSEGNHNYTIFNLHINGVYHCSLRYRQLHSFNEQLKKEYGSSSLPNFPPKKLLSLTSSQLEERRQALERYIQMISQMPNISNGASFNGFLLNAQQESQRLEAEDVTLDVFLMNGHKITTKILSTDQTDDVLETVASQIELSDDFVYYFGLYLIKKADGSENAIVRKLQEFESPYISLKSAAEQGTHRIVLRKSYWDPTYDQDLIEDRIAMNLIYVQAVSDVDRGWVTATPEQHRQLAALKQKGSKKEYLRLAATLKFYGFVQFRPCVTDYPQTGSRVLISAGNRELNFRIQINADQVKEAAFRVTRMRCWRITSSSDREDGLPNGSGAENGEEGELELSFEYLVAKDSLKWVTITSDQAILISMCLQGMVDELMMKKQGGRMKRPQDRVKESMTSSSSSHSNKRDATSNNVKSATSSSSPVKPLSEPDYPNINSPKHQPVRVISEKMSSLGFRANAAGTRSQGGSNLGPDSIQAPVTENDAFEGIGDDDL